MSTYLAENPLEAVIDFEEEPNTSILSLFVEHDKDDGRMLVQFDVRLANLMVLMIPEF